MRAWGCEGSAFTRWVSTEEGLGADVRDGQGGPARLGDSPTWWGIPFHGGTHREGVSVHVGHFHVSACVGGSGSFPRLCYLTVEINGHGCK